jgi:hypothetical protein
MNTWTLAKAELVHLLRETGLQPGPGSPLAGLELGSHSTILGAIERKPEVLRALGLLAKPEAVVGAMTFLPPEEPEYSWFYGASGSPGFAFYSVDEEGGHEIVWPVDRPLLLRSLGEPLFLEGPSERHEISISFDKAGFEALAVLADLAQEMGLLSLLGRKGPPGMTFERQDFLACARRSDEGEDWRWMVPRARLISPIDLDYGEEELAQGLRSLEAGRLIASEDGNYRLTPALGLLCAQLGATVGMTALSTRGRKGGTSGNGPQDWTVGHLAAVRTGPTLWLLEFQDITAAGFNIRFVGAGPNEIYGRLKAGLAAAPAAAAAAGFCRQCGSPLRAGVAFCPSCGSPSR